MYQMLNGARPGSSRNLMIGPGLITKNFDLSVFKPEDRSTWGELLGATKGGNEVSVDTEWHKVDVDGALGSVEGMEWLTKAEAKLSTNILEMTPENLQLKLPAFDIASHDENYNIIRHTGSIAPTGSTTLALFGAITGKSIPVVIVLENARCTDSFNLPFGNGKDDVVLKAEFEARYAEDEMTRIPFYILYPKGGSNVLAPAASPAPGTYDAPQSVVLTATAGHDIYYTMDGSYPTPINGTKYTGPISVDATVTIKAVAVKGQDTSAPVSFAYTINP
ncbi:chitobiase/beta-hexosaminidase C-terminal domain-containing protein [Bacillus sp. PK3_68]|uniref:chitobiase/beta-hexosaminidase C-terminal domain-containing protein n=1 Tax=Bacillus sp. PK3_68 TaxID=2027408 RepID=UPI00217DDA45|nr:chitobiase/beta-hexosaminidase C-terminal domain-containing protein [Bacillus sp. PK3_68]